MKNHQHKIEGFTLIEVLLVTVILSALALIAIQNYRSMSADARNAVALSDYRNLKTVVVQETLQEDQGILYVIGPLTGPAALPEPLAIARLSDGVQLPLALRISLGIGNISLNIIFFELFHEKGSERYRYLAINNQIVEQEIEMN